jgi:HAD superfamily hydrolase (TIGR01484 family)
MRPIKHFSKELALQIDYVFADIDDTLTTDGRLKANSYNALEELNNAGIKVVPVTGRPAGWCDLIARFWPVVGVIGENGAFYYSYDHKKKFMHRTFASPKETRANNQQKLKQICNRVLTEIPGAAISADQDFRDTDLAIDFCEDVPHLSEDDVQRIKVIFEEAGATAKVSSIHVNGWFGNHDKLSMTKQFCHEIFGFDLQDKLQQSIFVGDSPNDAPMFAHFPLACGVANINDFKDQMKAFPAWVTKERGGAGFIEVARTLLDSRKNKI